MTNSAKKESIFFKVLQRTNNDKVLLSNLLEHLDAQGIRNDDERLLSIFSALKEMKSGKINKNTELSQEHFEKLVGSNQLLEASFTRSLIIPEFDGFCNDIQEIFTEVEKNTAGKVADYIPQLSRVNPELFGVSICTVDGQRFSLGDHQHKFCLQSACKPINYCLAMEELGEEKVHSHVGREPSGHTFNELSLNKQKLPHNPMINAGAIMCAALIQRNNDLADRFEHVMDTWKDLCGNNAVSFNNSVYLSERQTADRNFALAYFMRENKAFPEKTDLTETLEFYFQCCSISSNTADTSIAAATLANAGVNPFTGKKIFRETTVQHCLSLMLSCGMYDFSGEFAFEVGLPAKSGVSGVIMLVIPNLMGISIYCPRLDALGNSVRGIEFCEKLVERFNFHHYDALNRFSTKKNPRLRKYESKVHKVVNLIWAASFGDINEIKRLEAEGVDLTTANYDGRTALHLAAANNRLLVAEYLLHHGLSPALKDRWGGTPLSDAKKNGSKAMIKMLQDAI